MYENFARLLKERGLKVTDVARATGISNSVFTDWKMGRYIPKSEKLIKVAEYFGVSVDYLMNGTESKNYYLNDETAQMAQEVFDNPDLRLLFRAARNSRPENVRLAAEMLLRMKETNHD